MSDSYVRILYYMAVRLEPAAFARLFLLQLLTMQSDAVANVRLALARVLSQAAHPGMFIVSL
jgi:hypothetical protein